MAWVRGKVDVPTLVGEEIRECNTDITVTIDADRITLLEG